MPNDQLSLFDYDARREQARAYAARVFRCPKFVPGWTSPPIARSLWLPTSRRPTRSSARAPKTTSSNAHDSCVSRATRTPRSPQSSVSRSQRCHSGAPTCLGRRSLPVGNARRRGDRGSRNVRRNELRPRRLPPQKWVLCCLGSSFSSGRLFTGPKARRTSRTRAARWWTSSTAIPAWSPYSCAGCDCSRSPSSNAPFVCTSTRPRTSQRPWPTGPSLLVSILETSSGRPSSDTTQRPTASTGGGSITAAWWSPCVKAPLSTGRSMGGGAASSTEPW